MQAAINHLKNCPDPHIRRIIQSIPPPVAADASGDIFYDLISCIVDQQIHHRSRKTYLKKLIDLLDGEHPTPANLLRLKPEDFAETKMANNKYLTVQRIAHFWQDHQVEKINWRELSDEEVKGLLGQIKGVGNWTQDMLLLYSLQRPDVLPADDYHLKKIMVTVYGLDPKSKLKQEILDIGKDWAPFKSTAVKYLLAWKAYLKTKPTTFP